VKKEIFRELRTVFAVAKVLLVILLYIVVVLDMELIEPQRQAVTAFSVATVAYFALTLAGAVFSHRSPGHTELVNRLSLIVDLPYVIYLGTLDLSIPFIGLLGFLFVVAFYSLGAEKWLSLVTLILCEVGFVASRTFFMTTYKGFLPAGVVLLNIVLGVTLIAVVYEIVYVVGRYLESLLRQIDLTTMELLDATLETEVTNQKLLLRNREVNTLLEVSEIITRSIEWEELFGNITVALKNSFKFRNFSLFLYDQMDNVLKLRISRGQFYDDEEAMSVGPSAGVAGWVFTNRASALVSNSREDPRFETFPTGRADNQAVSLLCVPIIYQGAALGAMGIDSPEEAAFSTTDEEFLESIASLIAVAIVHSMEYKQVKEESITDHLTGLTNYRRFQELLVDAVGAALRQSQSLSLLMIDIDSFKRVNDNFGHLVGNRVLQDLGDILRSFYRKSDIVSRYGGEEFTVILPGTPSDNAAFLADALRERIAEHKFCVDDEAQIFRHITVSIGVAGLSDIDLTEVIPREGPVSLGAIRAAAKLLVRCADEAMYGAKGVRKNAVVSYKNLENDKRLSG
jgi:diguanylate cyclase (GGDEF)-like protein